MMKCESKSEGMVCPEKTMTTKTKVKRVIIQLLGVVFVAIGLWLLKSMVGYFSEFYGSIQDGRKAMMSLIGFGGTVFMLIGGGILLICDPDCANKL